MVVKQKNEFSTINDISEACHAIKESIMIQEAGNDDFVVMSAEEYKRMEAEKKLINELAEAIVESNDEDSLLTLDQMKEEYGEYLV